jgi:glycosyltransferase involved in cell wall biosynthesis
MKERIIYLSPAEASFTRKDTEFLSKKYQVLTYPQNWSNKKKIFPNLVRQAIFLLKAIPGSKATFVMFGGYWSLFPALLGKLFQKPVFIILGGTDCVSFPEYNYGALRKPWLRQYIKLSYNFATKLLPVDESLVCSDYSYDPAVKEKKQGYKHFYPGLTTPYKVIHMGFETGQWQLDETTKNPKQFITIAKVDSFARFRIKGIDMVIELAKAFPDHQFHIAGMNLDYLESFDQLPENVFTHINRPDDEMRQLLRESQFYLQLSISEGFPNALCEAMLCECIPIVSKVGAMPFIVKDSGFIIEDRDINLVVQNISKALNYSPYELKTLGEKARMQVKDRFTIDVREKEFFRLLDNEIP